RVPDRSRRSRTSPGASRCSARSCPDAPSHAAGAPGTVPASASSATLLRSSERENLPYLSISKPLFRFERPAPIHPALGFATGALDANRNHGAGPLLPEERIERLEQQALDAAAHRLRDRRVHREDSLEVQLFTSKIEVAREGDEGAGHAEGQLVEL